MHSYLGRPYIAKCKKCNQIFEFPPENKTQVCTECQREDDNRVSEAVEMVVNTFGITKQDLTLEVLGLKSTQALENWIKQEIKPQDKASRQKLFALRQAANSWIALGYPSYAGMVDEPLPEGGTLKEALCKETVNKHDILFIGSGLALAAIKDWPSDPGVKLFAVQKNKPDKDKSRFSGRGSAF